MHFDLHEAGDDALVAHRLHERELQHVLARLRALLDVETLDAQALDAVGRRDDAAIEREVVGLARELRLQVAERRLDLAVGVAIEPACHLQFRDPGIEPPVLALEPQRLVGQQLAFARIGGWISPRRQLALLVGKPSDERHDCRGHHRSEPRGCRPATGQAGRKPRHESVAFTSGVGASAGSRGATERARARRGEGSRERSMSSDHHSGRGGGPPENACSASSCSARA